MRSAIGTLITFLLIGYGLGMIVSAAHADSTTICTKTETGIVCTTTTTSKFPKTDLPGK